MTILVTADWHLSDNQRDSYRHLAMREIRDIVRQHNVERVLVLGDLTEAKDHHGAWLVNEIVNHLTRLTKLCRVTVLRGNHDAVDVENPFFAFVQHIEGLAWVNSPTSMKIKGLGDCLFLPHTNDYKRDWQGLPLRDVDRVFAHATFEGVNLGHRTAHTGIPTSLFPNVQDYVITGDVHAPQRVGGNVIYVGAPVTVDFGDDYNPRVLLIDGGKLKSIAMQGPQKRLVEMTSNLRHYSPHKPNDIVKVRINLKSGEYAKWSEIRQRVQSWAIENQLTLHTVQPIVEQGVGPIKRQPQAQRSDADLLRDYAQRQGLDERTLKVGLKLLQEV